MAASTSLSFGISTKPNPRERPVLRSVITWALATAPCGPNKLRKSAPVVWNVRFPTKIFFNMVSFLI
jgi:hypothetical protein